MVQKGNLDAKIKIFFDREKIIEENLKRELTILRRHCTESLLAKLEGG